MPDDEKPQDTAQGNKESQPPLGQGSFEKRLRVAAIKRAEVLAAKNAETDRSAGDLASPSDKPPIRKYYVKSRHRSLPGKDTQKARSTSDQAGFKVVAPRPLLLEAPLPEPLPFEPLPPQPPEDADLAQVFRSNIWGRGRFGKICSALFGAPASRTWAMAGTLLKVAFIFTAGVAAGILLL